MGGALVVVERQHRADTRRRVVAQFALDAVVGVQLPRHGAEVGVGRHFERQRDAAFDVALAQLNREQADLGGEEGAVLLALGQHQTHDVGVIVDHLQQVGGFEGGVADAAGLDHGTFPWGVERRINHHGGANSRQAGSADMRLQRERSLL